MTPRRMMVCSTKIATSMTKLHKSDIFVGGLKAIVKLQEVKIIATMTLSLRLNFLYIRSMVLMMLKHTLIGR
jgi:hypothetical protein